mmetsp:Transcript_128580/g.274235  ORF Transcript_128580/g.274235 Transcript_128580/m.274235 type:complete len:319 (+) Transcript_128580:170-1126(+)
MAGRRTCEALPALLVLLAQLGSACATTAQPTEASAQGPIGPNATQPTEVPKNYCCATRRLWEAYTGRAVNRIRDTEYRLATEVRSNISRKTAPWVARVDANTTAQAAEVAKAFRVRSKQQRESAVAAARKAFDLQVLYKDNLAESAEHQLVLAGEAAMKTAAEDDAQVEGPKLQQSLGRALASLRGSMGEMERSRSTAERAARESRSVLHQRSRKFYAMWKDIASSVGAANKALEASRGPREAAIWSDKAAALATGLVGTSRGRTAALSAQVDLAAERAQEALKATKANSQIISALEGMVEEADEGARIASGSTGSSL